MGDIGRWPCPTFPKFHSTNFYYRVDELFFKEACLSKLVFLSLERKWILIGRNFQRCAFFRHCAFQDVVAWKESSLSQINQLSCEVSVAHRQQINSRSELCIILKYVMKSPVIFLCPVRGMNYLTVLSIYAVYTVFSLVPMI